MTKQELQNNFGELIMKKQYLYNGELIIAGSKKEAINKIANSNIDSNFDKIYDKIFKSLKKEFRFVGYGDYEVNKKYHSRFLFCTGNNVESELRYYPKVNKLEVRILDYNTHTYDIKSFKLNDNSLITKVVKYISDTVRDIILIG